MTATPPSPPPPAPDQPAPAPGPGVAIEGVRAFLAVNAAVESVRKVADMQMSMRSTAKSRGLRVSWVPAANMHLTLKFFGWIPREQGSAVIRELGQRLVERRPFTVTLAGVGAFPTVDKPRVLWVGVQDPSGELARLAGDVETWMRGLGFPAEARAFAPHLTIGRVKEGGSAQDLLAPHQAKQFSTSTIGDVVLYESRVVAKGAEYAPLGRVTLGQSKTIETWPEFPPFVSGQPRAADTDIE